MSITVGRSAFVVGAGQTISLAQMFNVAPGGANPAYLVLTGLDRSEYTATEAGNTGSLSGNGQTDLFYNSSGDERTAGIVFTYQASTGRYYNSIYGYLDDLTYTASTSPGDVTNLSLFGFNSLQTAEFEASNPYGLSYADPAGYLGSVTVATEPGFSGTPATQATPDSIASVATSFVGDVWNMDGCWVLASTIAAEAGTSLPVDSSYIGIPGQSNGEWQVAFDGPAGQTGNWQSMVTTGDIIVIGNDQGLGHITTCVSGAGSTAMLVDNATFYNRNGVIFNAANDGSPLDIIIQAAHPASAEWATVATNDVVIYRLDTPLVHVARSSASIICGLSLTLGGLFSAVDPFNKAVTQWQIFDTASTDSLSFGAGLVSAHGAPSACTVGTLTAASLVAGGSACSDTVEVRAYNGSYWGDWQSLAVTVTSALAPTLAKQTGIVIWTQGSSVAFTLPAGTFADPQGEALTYSATLSSGQALPSWLSFNPATQTFSGVVANIAQTLSLRVTATDMSGLSTSETFQAVVPAVAPLLVHQTAAQSWTEGQAVSLTLAPGTFVDPQGEALTYRATLANGQALPSWLSFNPATQAFSGTPGYVAGTILVKVTATDTSGLFASDTFQATLAAPPPTLAHQTARQTWVANTAVSFRLAADTFTAVPGQTLTYRATLSSGAPLPAGLTFNPATQTFGGTAPVAPGTYAITVTATETSGLATTETFQVQVTASPPTLVNQTPTQDWTANRMVSFTLPANTFADPQGERLTEKVTLSGGGALPSWLTFDPLTGTLIGMAPTTPGTLALKVTATDASGLSVAETFNAVIQAAAPSTLSHIPTPTWTANRPVSFTLPRNTFVDPQGETLTYRATTTNGSPLPAGLAFNGSTDTFTGTAPITPETLGLTVTATNASGLSATAAFNAVIQASSPTLAHATAAQSWTDGRMTHFLLPAATFVDPQGSALTLSAFQVSGPDQTAWLRFDPTIGDFYGTPPAAASGTIGLAVVARDAYGLTASESFGLSFAPPGGHPTTAAFNGHGTEMLALHA